MLSVALPITIGTSGRTFGISPQWSRCPWEKGVNCIGDLLTVEATHFGNLARKLV
jgi:hypothetical protein